MKKYTILFILTAFLTVSVNAQFRIKVPKIKKPKINRPAAETQANNSKVRKDSASLLTKSREMVMDDGFTFFDAEPVKVHDPSIRGYKDAGWNMMVYLRLFGTFPARSGLKLIVSKDGQPAGKIRCEGKVYQKAGDFNLQTPLLRQGKDLNYDNYLEVSRCLKKKTVIKGTGKFDVDVYFFNGDTDEETLVRKYKIDVHRAPRVRGSAVKPQPDVAHYYISRHSEVPASFLYLDSTGFNNYGFNYRDANLNNRVEVYFSYSPKKTTNSLPAAYARCSVNGQRLQLPGPSPYKDEVLFRRTRYETAIYTDRIAQQYKRGSEYRDEVAFNLIRAVLPISFGNKNENRIKMQDYPGDWECSILSDGEKIRTFRWKTDENGRPIPHPEQASGNINLLHNTYLVETIIPEGGSEFDYRLAPMPNEGFFYGIPWTSAKGKMMAASVPKKGIPFHIPSNEAK